MLDSLKNRLLFLLPSFALWHLYLWSYVLCNSTLLLYQNYCNPYWEAKIGKCYQLYLIDKPNIVTVKSKDLVFLLCISVNKDFFVTFVTQGHDGLDDETLLVWLEKISCLEGHSASFSA